MKKPSEVSKVIGPILKQVISTVRKKHEDELSKLKIEYDQDISILKEKVDSLVSTSPQRREINKPLFFTGISLLVALIALALVSGRLQYAVSDAVYWVLGICGTALIASSVFGSGVFERFKHL